MVEVLILRSLKVHLINRMFFIYAKTHSIARPFVPFPVALLESVWKMWETSVWLLYVSLWLLFCYLLWKS